MRLFQIRYDVQLMDITRNFAFVILRGNTRKEEFNLKKMNKVRLISIGGILTTITVLFQSAPVFLPAVGLLFSPLSTLPVAIAAFYHIPLGLTVLISSALILTLVSIQEAIILLLTTGLLGIVIGTFLYRKGMLISIVFSTIILFLGMVSLTYIVGISAFGDLTSSASIPLTLFIFTVFSLIYTSIWNIYIRKFINYLIKGKIINIG